MVTIAQPSQDPVRLEILLSQKMVDELKITSNFINDIDLTSDRLVVLSTTDQFYILGWGGMVPLGNKTKGYIHSFAVTPENLLMVIKDNEICVFDSAGNLKRLYSLLSDRMGISAGKYALYVYDLKRWGKKHPVYVIAGGGKYTKLLELPTAITAALEMGSYLLFSTENGLFRYHFIDKQLQALVALPAHKEIRSIAIDTASNRIYFSTDSTVYALVDSGTVIITDKSGGILKYFNDGLVVFNPEKNFLFRITGIEKKIRLMEKASKTKVAKIKTPSILTNESVIEMVKINMSDDMIISIIGSSQVNFDVTINAMINLSNKNVPSTVIKAMKNAMNKKKQKNTINIESEF
ncbi:MAG: hypothetical protein WCK84_12680 [Bacteroidota bacterium]